MTMKEALVAHLLDAHGIEAADDVSGTECAEFHDRLHTLFDPRPDHPRGEL